MTEKSPPVSWPVTAEPPPGSDRPVLLRAVGDMNVAVYRGRFFAIPQQLGDVSTLDLSQREQLPSGVLVGDTIEALVGEMEYVARWANSRGNFEAEEAQPIFRAASALGEPEMSVVDGGFSIVKGDGEFYAVRTETINYLTNTVQLRGARHATADVSVEFAFSAVSGIAMLGQINDYLAFVADGIYMGVHHGLAQRLSADPRMHGVPLYEYPGVVKAKTYPALLQILGWRRDRRLQGMVARGTQPAERPQGAAARVVRSLHGYSIIAYEGWFYGVPEALGPVDLAETDPISLPGVIADVAQAALEQVIQDRTALCDVPAPVRE
jgi:hypothetical protein